MNCSIPAKTFLLGEYAATAGYPALILTSTPCFKIERTDAAVLDGIHPESPAGRYWQDHAQASYGLRFYDPYQAIGGLGASSAQFIGAFRAENTDQPLNQAQLLEAYFSYAWNGVGIRPSGYDLLAQCSSGMVYLHQQQGIAQSTSWPFEDLTCVLLHTGNKLATHTHLQQQTPSNRLKELGECAQMAWEGIQHKNSDALLLAVKQAAGLLDSEQLVASHSRQLLEELKALPFVKACKGCGAMGADVIAVLLQSDQRAIFQSYCQRKNHFTVGASTELYAFC